MTPGAIVAVCLLLSDRDLSKRLNEEGLKLLDGHRTREAEQRLRRAVEADPQNVEALNNLGVALRREEQFAAAVKILRKAALAAPGDARIHSNLALALWGAENFAEATAEMAKAATLDPENTAISRSYGIYCRDYGIALYRKGDAAGAIAKLRKAVELLPGDPAVHYNLGRALSKVGRSGEAAAELKLAQQQNERTRDAIRAKALNNEGNKLLESGQLEEGLARLREAVTLAPDDAISQYNYGVALLLAKNTDEAIERFRATLRLKSDQPNAYYYLGRAFMLKLDWQAAADSLKEAARLNPGDDAVRRALAEAERHTRPLAPGIR